MTRIASPLLTATCSAFILLAVNAPLSAKTLTLSSPDGNLSVSIDDDDGLSYQVAYQQQPALLASRLGLTFANRQALGPTQVILDHQFSSKNQSWQQPWGERKTIVDHHNEAYLTVANGPEDEHSYGLRVRVFNDGLGFRYEGKGAGDELLITGELTEFVLPEADKTDAWWVPARGWNRYEYQYQQTKLADIDRVNTPFTLRTESGLHISIHEAALVDFAEMSLDQRRTGTLKADLVPRSDGLKVKTHTGFVSPWRTIQVAPEATGLLNSDLILNLNEPNALGNVDWVEPGKYIGIWWGMHLNVHTWGSGDKHGATTERTKAYMDFAAQNGFDGVLVEGWNLGWDGSWFDNGDVFSFTQPYDDFDLSAVSAYGAEKGVRLIGHHETSGSISNYEDQMEAAYDLYEKHGVRQVKTGYVADGGNIKRIDENGIVRHEWHGSQHTVNHYLHSIKRAAEHKISINTHEPIKDTGLRRTYPNWISREGARGQEFNAWGSPPNSPAHTVNLVYTRMLSGPMDFTPGIFNLAFEGLDAENRVQTTLAKQLALYVVLYSPIQMAADLPEHYGMHPTAFEFIKAVPTDWQESVALSGEVGKYAVIARQQRNSEDWYVGAITNEDARQVTIDLNFLEPERTYQAIIYQDGKDADWKTNPYALDKVTKNVTKADTLSVPLATSGGVAIQLVAQ